MMLLFAPFSVAKQFNLSPAHQDLIIKTHSRAKYTHYLCLIGEQGTCYQRKKMKKKKADNLCTSTTPALTPPSIPSPFFITKGGKKSHNSITYS